MRRLLLAVLALLVFAPSAWAAPPAPCLSCVLPSTTGQANQTPLDTLSRPIQNNTGLGTTQAAPLQTPGAFGLPQTADKPDADARSEAFFTGKPRRGVFDPNPVKLWYLVDKENLKLPIFQGSLLSKLNPTIASTDAFSIGDKSMGGAADFFFTLYKILVHAALSLAGVIVFGFMFVGSLLEAALSFSHHINDLVVGPFQLLYIPLLFGAAYVAWLVWVEKRLGAGLAEFVIIGLLLSIGLQFLPEGPARWIISLVASGSAVVLLAASGENPAHLPGPSTAPINTDQVIAAYDKFVGNLESLMIGRVGEVLTFGGELPPKCEVAYRQGQALRLSATDPDNFKFLNKIPECGPWVKQAIQPDAPRAAFAFLLVLYAFAFAGVILVLAWPAIKGQIRLIAAVATHKLLVVGAAMPGPFRGPTVRIILFTFIGLMTTLLLAVIFSLILLFMVAIYAATAKVNAPMGLRLILMLAVPFAFLFSTVAMERGARKRANRLSQTMHRKGGVASGMSQPLRSRAAGTVLRGNRLVTPKQAMAFGAAGVVAGGAYEAHKKATSAFTGGQRRPGLFMGAKTRPVRDEQGNLVKTPDGKVKREPVTTHERIRSGMAATAARGAYSTSANSWQSVMQTKADVQQEAAQRRRTHQDVQNRVVEEMRPSQRATTPVTPIKPQRIPVWKDPDGSERQKQEQALSAWVKDPRVGSQPVTYSDAKTKPPSSPKPSSSSPKPRREVPVEAARRKPTTRA